MSDNSHRLLVLVGFASVLVAGDIMAANARHVRTKKVFVTRLSEDSSVHIRCTYLDYSAHAQTAARAASIQIDEHDEYD